MAKERPRKKERRSKHDIEVAAIRSLIRQGWRPAAEIRLAQKRIEAGLGRLEVKIQRLETKMETLEPMNFSRAACV